MLNQSSLALCALTLASSTTLRAQDAETVVRNHLSANRAVSGLTAADVEQVIVTDRSTSAQSGTTFLYIQQTVQGLPVHNAVASFAVRDGRVVHAGDRMIRDLAGKAGGASPGLEAPAALLAAAAELGQTATGDAHVMRVLEDGTLVLDPAGIALDPIKARLIYQPVADGRVLLAWDLTIRSVNGHDWWHLGVDASTGAILRNNNYIVECAFPTGGMNLPTDEAGAMSDAVVCSPAAAAPPPAPDGYRVYAVPVESPNHGSRSMAVDPADAVASPLGWHDTDGSPGAEHTITRGNNVLASEDFDNNNQPGYSPDGGGSLEFDFPINLTVNPDGYLDASITNLFYWNNIMHDVWHRYGFDAQSGNFQSNNYGQGGLGGDHVIAEGQDGGGVNNANFAAPPDGENGRMQMYNWTDGASSPDNLTVNSPAGIAGVYTAPEAGFGPGAPGSPVTADVVLIADDTAPESDGCQSLVNAPALSGKIVLIDRGNCTFVIKVQAAQDAGSVGVIMVNNVAGAPITMGGTSGTITIPAVMISQADGALIRDLLDDGPVNATIQNPNNERDGCLDNVVIAHEYGHGISIRLTGGPGNSDCLSNDEQMGEGWSDWLGLMLTIEPGDQGSDGRGIGTFAQGQPVTGVGIRPARYSTDFAMNNYTYAATNNTGSISEPHGIGFVWCTMLWDMTWELIDAHGFDPDLYTGNGGNNIAMHLVIEAMKLQPCSPGFVDGRDAILAADELLYDGAHHCLIWQAFARRGLGASADQGSSESRTDQVQAFNLPVECMSVGLVEPSAAQGITLFPDPANEQVTIDLGRDLKGDVMIELLDAGGRSLTRTIVGSGSTTHTMELSRWASGSYIVQLSTPGHTHRQRLQIVH